MLARPPHRRSALGFNRAVAASLTVVLGVLVALVAANPGAALGAGRSYRNEQFGINQFELPRGWTVAPQPGYPRLLLLATVPVDGNEKARLLLGAQRVPPGTTAMRLAADAQIVLLKQGFTDVKVTPAPPGVRGDERMRLDAMTAGNRKVLRQVYAVDRDAAVVVTMVVPATKALRGRNFESDFLTAVESLELAPLPSATPPVETPPPASPDGGTSGGG